MNQNQDELQAAINNITNNGATPEGEVSAESVISQIEQSMGGAPSAVSPAELAKNTATATAPVAAATSAVNTVGAAPVATAVSDGTEGIAETGVKMESVAVEATPSAAPVAEPAASSEPVEEFVKGNGQVETVRERAMYGDPDMDRVKSDALTELRPMLDRLDLEPQKKFYIYKDIIEMTGDKSCLDGAYKAARQIENEKDRANALIFIVEFIDELGVKMPEA